MYTAFLVIHSYVRWVVLLTGLIAVVRGISGVAGGRPWEQADESASRRFLNSLDAQATIGIILYVFLSPFTMEAWSDPAGTLRNAPLRFIAIEHQTGMIVGLALAHIGRERIRDASSPLRRHRLAAIFFGLAMVAILVSIPWPFMPGGRTLLRGIE